MNNQSRHNKALELDAVLAMLAGLTSCADTKALALSLVPCRDFDETRRLMARTADAHSLSNRFGTPSIYQLTPCRDLAKRAQVGGALSPRELLDAAYILKTTRTLLQWKRQSAETQTSLDPLFSLLTPNKTLEDEISSCILSEEEIADHASSELADIRRKIRSAGQRAREQLDRMIRSSTYQKYLQEQIVTLRNGRFVVPVKAEFRGEVAGLVHDTSASGATLFIEPMSVVEANNQIRELESREQHEIQRILLELSGKVGDFADRLTANYDLLIELDLYFAKSRLADKMKAGAPELTQSGETALKKARHPLIPADKVVPIDIALGGKFDTLVITGPNTGGKTVALKTLGLLTLMSQCGLMIPAADGSTVRVYHSILADIGDEQSIEQSLSTFSGHMTNIVQILQQSGPDTLVLIDELGAGTDPTEGAALAVAILDRLRQLGAKVAATTHYAEMKIYALQTEGVENGSCEFDIATLRPTYRLLIGVPGRSNAFAISERLGLPIGVIEAAKEQVSHESARFEEVVSGLEQTRQQLEGERELAKRYRREADEAKRRALRTQEGLEAEKEKEIQLARDKARSMVEQVRFQSQQLLKELEELKKQKDREDFSLSVADARSTFKAYLKDLEEAADPVTRKSNDHYRLPRPLVKGDRVELVEYGGEGIVIAAPDQSGNVQVQAGVMKTTVPLGSLRLIEKPRQANASRGSASARRVTARAKEDARAELDLRGMTSDEALLELERYIDNAILSNIKTVTIIHGKGTGALRAAVQNRLRAHRAVESYRLGIYGEGESGVTIAELK